MPSAARTGRRRYLYATVERDFARARREGYPITVMMIDIDRFKDVNDTYGHTTGDEVLRTIGARLREQIRHPDTIGRYGGEEFLIVLPNSELKAAVEQASRLCQHVRGMHIEFENHNLSVTVSIGVCGAISQTSDIELLENASQTLKKAVEAGGNIVRVF